MTVYGLLLIASNLLMADKVRLRTYIRPLKLAYVDAGDKAELQQAFAEAVSVVFKDFPLSARADTDSLVIHTYLTDEIPSYPVVNFALWIIVPSLAVGAAAIESEAFVGDQMVAVAVGARNGTIGLSGYTKWGVIEQGFEIWLKGIRQWLDKVDASNN